MDKKEQILHYHRIDGLSQREIAAEHDGVAFEDLPDDWKCPRCKQPKEKFNPA